MRFAAFILLLSLPSFGATYYVRDGGTGASPASSWAGAYDQLTSAETAASRGDTIYIADGTYNGVTFNTAASSTTRITIKKATVADHGTETGWDNTYGDGQAVCGSFVFSTDYWTIDGVSRNESDWFAGSSYGIRTTQIFARNIDAETGGDHLIFNYIDVGSRTYSQTFASGDGDEAVYLGGFSARIFDITISRCFLHNGGFIQMAGVDGITVEYTALAAGYAKESIRGQVVAKNGIIRYCLFYNASQTNPDDDPPQGSTADIAIWDDGSSGQTSFDNWQIYGNVIWNDKSIGHSGGVIIVGGNGSSWAGSSASNVKIYNNTIVGIQGAFTPAHILINGGTGNEVRNNLWYDCFSTPTASPNTSNNGEAVSDPFVNYAGFDFHLTAGIAGTSISSPYDTDLDGVTRGADGTFDRGAFEFEAEPTPPGVTVTGVTLSGGVSIQ